ncbi:MAG: glycosyltransferase, partial [Actinocrinis sp.]
MIFEISHHPPERSGPADRQSSVIEQNLYPLPEIDLKSRGVQRAREGAVHAPEPTGRRAANCANAWTRHDAQLILPSVTSVVVPAHNEAAVIGRLLSGLVSDVASEASDGAEAFETIVVANGCTDDTEQVASRFPGVRVVATPVPNKHRALRLGDEHARDFPRIYVDADVELSAAGVRALARALRDPGVHAVAPQRHTPLDGIP